MSRMFSLLTVDRLPSLNWSMTIKFPLFINYLFLLETTLKLDTLVGDIEDAVLSIVNRNLRKRPSSHNLEVTITLDKL